MRIGANIDLHPESPADWIRMLRSIRARAAVSPIDCAADAAARRAYARAARENDIVIAEVGVWNNPMDPDGAARAAAVRRAQRQLELAEELGANCCVIIAGARGSVWNGCYPGNRGGEAWDMAVNTVREIIDAVRPRRTFYTLEPVGWMIPASPEEYLRLIRDVDRPAFAVHMDFTNMIIGVDHYLDRAERFRHMFRLLGPYVKSVHAKDIRLENDTPCRILEVPPGRGEVDFEDVLRLSAALGGSKAPLHRT